MTRKEPPNNKQLAVLAASALVLITATAYLVSFWLPKPFAYAIPVFVWLFAVYWIPPKPKMRPWVWLILVALMSGVVFFLVTFGLDPF